MRKLLAYISALILAVSCVTELEQDGLAVNDSLEGAPVTITFSVPNVTLAPVTKEAAGEARKAMRLAASSGVPMRPSG